MDTGYALFHNNGFNGDFPVPKRFVEGAFRYLTVGDRLVMVVKRLDWSRNKKTTVFGGVRVMEKKVISYLRLRKGKMDENKIV